MYACLAFVDQLYAVCGIGRFDPRSPITGSQLGVNLERISIDYMLPDQILRLKRAYERIFLKLSGI